jgi:2-succinyl-5-enolpyruvyl-6-hydroxy-3-cyclohexene-1-carboxylate synthase
LPPKLVESYLEAFIDGLGEVDNVVFCPGSRSTPLVVEFHSKKRFRLWAMYDERSAGFFALGIAKSSSKPVVLIATSGTAVANFFPAIVEAKLSSVPLIVVTADRPPEARDFGAPQTIDQIRIYGTYPKFFQDMPVMSTEGMPSLLRYARIVGARATHIALTEPAGPVHINFSFREPLISKPMDTMSDESSGDIATSTGGNILVTRVRRTAESQDVQIALKDIADGSKGWIVVGPEDHSDLKDELARLSQVLGWPILADPLSNLRNTKVATFGLVRAYEALLRNKNFRETNHPEWVLQVGGAPTSKWLNTVCENTKKIVLAAGDDWRDPSFAACSVIYGDLKTSLVETSNALKNFHPPLAWLKTWIVADDAAFRATELAMQNLDLPFEGKLFYNLSKNLAPKSKFTVLVGNSMPVRDLDAFFLEGHENIRFVGNKGVNGIDGLVATAMGISAIEGNVLLILGDIAFYHDMNGLLAATLHKLKATIIIVNNRGGGIFSFLPQHDVLPKETFENLFGESHDLDFSGVQTIYGGQFFRVDSWQAFDKAVASSIDASGLKILEFRAADRETNLALHASTFDKISSSVTE